MPRKPATKRKTRKKHADGPLAAIRWDVVKERGKPVALGLAIMVSGVLALTAINALNSRASAELAKHDGVPLAADELRLHIAWPTAPGAADGESWLPEQDQAEILRRARAAVRQPDPLSVRPLALITDALADTGWFQGDPVARRDPSGEIVISGTWRVPAAVVRYGGWDHLISWQAMPMPRRYGTGASNQRVILNAAFAPGPSENPADRYKSPWPGEDVSDALSLLRLLAERNLVAEIEAIDVAAHDEGRIELVTIHNTRIEWGAAPGRWRPGQATDDERIARLERLSGEFGRIDGGARRVRIAGAHIERLGTR